MTKAILSFSGDNFYLDNFYEAPTPFAGKWYPTSEHAFVAAKTDDPALRLQVARMSDPGLAKAFGRRLKLRPHWNDIRIGFMYEIVWAKFDHHFELRERLIATGNVHLEEGNHHEDRFWGTVDGVGENHLGKILMAVRKEFQIRR